MLFGIHLKLKIMLRWFWLYKRNFKIIQKWLQRLLSGRAFASHVGVRGTIPGGTDLSRLNNYWQLHDQWRCKRQTDWHIHLTENNCSAIGECHGYLEMIIMNSWSVSQYAWRVLEPSLLNGKRSKLPHLLIGYNL